MPSVIITQPVSPGGIPGTILTNINIPYNTTQVVDGCPCSTNMSVKWLYTLINQIDQTVVSGEVLAKHSFGTPGTEKHNVYSIVGDIQSMPHKIDVQLAGGSPSGILQLSITNKDINSNDWKANVVRIQLLS